MQKEIYLIQGLQDENYSGFHSRISGMVEFIAETLKPGGLKYTITAKAPPPVSIIPFSKKLITAVSVYKEETHPVSNLIDADGFYGAYRVTEALPVTYTKYWTDGDATPGACLLTLFRKKKDIDHNKFIDRWHNSHTPLSLRYHPLWNYNRNVAHERLTSDSIHFDGIVEEQVRKPSDLLNPFKFFGNPLVIIPRMLHVYADTKAFIDYPTMETYLANEYHIISK